MNTSTRKASRPLVLLALLLALVAAGCSSRIGTSWPVLDTVELYGQTRILVGYNSIVALLDPSNGSVTQLQDGKGNLRKDTSGNPLRWAIDGGSMEKAEFFGRPVLVQEPETQQSEELVDYLWFPSHNGRLLKIDLENAKIESAKGVKLSSPVIADLVANDDLIYVPLQYGDVVALDRDSLIEGETDAEGYIEATEVWRAKAPDGVWSAPIISDGVMYVSTISHFLYAYNAETGEAVWPQPIDLGGLAGASPLVTEDAIYIGSYGHKMFKISKDGQILATFEGTNWFWSTPVLVDGILYTTDLGGYVYALKAEDMTQVWGGKIASRGIRPAPIVSGDYVVAASRDGSIYWLNRETGEQVNRRELEGHPEILSDMLLLTPENTSGISEPLIVVGTADTARLAVAFPLDPNSGYQGWIYSR